MLTKERKSSRADLSGMVFNAWKVVSYAGKDKNGLTMWDCLCECGAVAKIYSQSLKIGRSKSCGCTRPKTSLGMALSPEYQAYQDAKGRCTNSNSQKFNSYGGRGIKFLFTSFPEFFSELGQRPAGLSVDRIDNNGHYEPGNVRWATRSQQLSNRNPYHRKFRARNEVAKRFMVQQPDSTEIEVLNLSDFCRQHNLSSDMMYRSAKTNIVHRGYSAQLI